MAESTTEDTNQSVPKNDAPKLTRKERQQAWTAMSRGNEHPER